MNRRNLLAAIALSPLMPLAAKAGDGGTVFMGMDLASGPDQTVHWVYMPGDYLYIQNGPDTFFVQKDQTEWVTVDGPAW